MSGGGGDVSAVGELVALPVGVGDREAKLEGVGFGVAECAGDATAPRVPLGAGAWHAETRQAARTNTSRCERIQTSGLREGDARDRAM